jgi:hypothetical protein
MGSACSTNDEKRNARGMLVLKPEAKRPLGRAGRRWNSSIEINLRWIGLGSTNWIHVTQDRGEWMSLLIKLMSLLVI